LILVIILFSFFTINSAFCNDQTGGDYQFSIGTQFGFVSGEALELIYPTNTHVDLLSELTWEMKPVLYYGIQVDISRSNFISASGFFTSLSFRMGIPGVSGIHENRDWQSDVNNELTDFSSHTNKTKEFYLFDAAFGFSIPAGVFYIKPFINFSWMRFSYSGNDGNGTYARRKSTNPDTYHSIDDNPIKISYSGQEVIRYQQDWYLISAGFTIGTQVLFPLALDLSFQISPLTYCVSRDDHLSVIIFGNKSPHRVYKDYTSLGLFLEPAGKISITAGRFDFSIIGAYRYIGRTKGPAYSDFGNRGLFIQNGEAGAALSIFDVRFLVDFKIWQNLKN